MLRLKRVLDMATVASPQHTARQDARLVSANVLIRTRHLLLHLPLLAPEVTLHHPYPSRKTADVARATMDRLAKVQSMEIVARATTIAAQATTIAKRLLVANPPSAHVQGPRASSRLFARSLPQVPHLAHPRSLAAHCQRLLYLLQSW